MTLKQRVLDIFEHYTHHYSCAEVCDILWKNTQVLMGGHKDKKSLNASVSSILRKLVLRKSIKVSLAKTKRGGNIYKKA
jgi:hypothetical protein